MTKLDATHAEYDRAIEDWRFMHDAIAGERAIKEGGETYLPMTPGMISQRDLALTDASADRIDPRRRAMTRYEAYKLRAEFPEKVAPAIDSAVGLMTDKPAAIEVPDAWAPLAESMSPDGDTAQDFHRLVAQEVCGNGRAGIWVDVGANGLPYFVLHRAAEILNWSERKIGDQKQLDRLTLKIDDAINGEAVEILTIAELDERGLEIERYVRKKSAESREWETLEAPQPRRTSMAGTEVVMGEEGAPQGFRLNFIPFQFINATSTTAHVGRIPFLPLAQQCLKVYRMDANYQEALSFYEPTPVVTGMTDEWIRAGYAPKSFGAGALWLLPSGADAKMLEYSGPSIENLRVGIMDALARANELAMRPFEPQIANVESGEAKKERRKTQTSAAKVMAQNIGSGIQKALRMAGDWLGAPADKLRFAPSYDFVEGAMDAQTLTAYIAAQQAGAISKETLHEIMQRGGVTNRAYDEERELIEKGQ